MAAQLAQVAAGTTPAATPRPDLTADDVRLLQLLADGLTTRQIGKQLGCTPHAASGRTSRLYTRIGARNAAHAVGIAYRAGLLPTSRPPASRPARPAWDHCGPGGISNPHPLHPGQTCDQYDATRARR